MTKIIGMICLSILLFVSSPTLVNAADTDFASMSPAERSSALDKAIEQMRQQPNPSVDLSALGLPTLPSSPSATQAGSVSNLLDLPALPPSSKETQEPSSYPYHEVELPTNNPTTSSSDQKEQGTSSSNYQIFQPPSQTTPFDETINLLDDAANNATGAYVHTNRPSPITIEKNSTRCSGTFICTLQSYLNNGGCWFCPIYRNLLNAINTFATTMFTALAKIAMILLGFGLLFIIAFKVGRMALQLQEVSASQFFQDLFKSLGRGIIAAALLEAVSFTNDNIFNLLITPFLEMALSLSSAIVTVLIT